MTAHRRRADGSFTWEGVEVLAYKPDPETGHPGTFRDLTRQVLFDGNHLASQVRFFDVGPGGHTTLERHGHAHAVIVLRGRGRCLVGEEVLDLLPHDLIEVGPWQWHQFRAASDEPLGFVCIVDQDRDRPQLPTDGDLEQLDRNPAVASFLAGTGRRAGPDDPDGPDDRVAAADREHPEHPAL
ncbi:MAG: cupin domain-containing protein [Acidimicrobiales bacterium]